MNDWKNIINNNFLLKTETVFLETCNLKSNFAVIVYGLI